MDSGLLRKNRLLVIGILVSFFPDGVKHWVSVSIKSRTKSLALIAGAVHYVSFPGNPGGTARDPYANDVSSSTIIISFVVDLTFVIVVLSSFLCLAGGLTKPRFPSITVRLRSLALDGNEPNF